MPQETLTRLLAAGWGGKEGTGGRPWVPRSTGRAGSERGEAEKAPKERVAAILSKRSSLAKRAASSAGGGPEPPTPSQGAQPQPQPRS